ncbi:energy-coupling factor transport system ATP-binding protein [Seinonella peptonophila]|uniref:Energy-coupling factor transport system ATP-binding protein n=1 Tax=Seinonella peptonophila TaxID=112248 RepID=A0A1M5BAK6_9BACL|nr:ATP-binding cassette domain-containing protein [Seinonella peptonophila]SHF39357.1 energy-coupling factor transport system ATP-binding protein [Seinonella peptonophila]
MKIELRNLAFSYLKEKKREPIYLFEQLNCTIESGDFLALAGKSGSGKTTLLHCLKGFYTPTKGEVLIDGKNPFLKKNVSLFDSIGYVFQYPEHQLFARTVYEDIAFALQQLKKSEQEIEKQVKWAMERVNLPFAIYKDRSPFELSGGEKRRVAIAGVIVQKPTILILDEPTAGLDLHARSSLFSLLHELNQMLGITIIWVSHHPEEIIKEASRLLLLHNGKLMADGNPTKLLATPSILQKMNWDEPDVLKIQTAFERKGWMLNSLWDITQVASYWQKVNSR